MLQLPYGPSNSASMQVLVYPAIHTQAVPVELESAGQFVHIKSLTSLLYFPAAHAVHVLAPSSKECVPTPQLAHDAVPAVLLNFPVMHGVHALEPATVAS